MSNVAPAPSSPTPVSPNAVKAVREAPRHYLNRLSDLMFVLSRVLNRMDGGDDVYWKSERLARSAQDERKARFVIKNKNEVTGDFFIGPKLSSLIFSERLTPYVPYDKRAASAGAR